MKILSYANTATPVIGSLQDESCHSKEMVFEITFLKTLSMLLGPGLTISLDICTCRQTNPFVSGSVCSFNSICLYS